MSYCVTNYPYLVLQQHIFIFNKALFSPNTPIDKCLSEPQLIPLSIPPVPPLHESSPTSIVSILNTFVDRAKWSSSLLTLSHELFEAIESNVIEITIIKQAVDISLTHLRHHSASIVKSLESTAVISNTLNENAEADANWKQALEVSSKIPIHKSLLAGHSNSTHLSDWIDHSEIQTVSTRFENDRSSISSSLQTIYSKVDEMLAKVNTLESNAKIWFGAPTAPILSEAELNSSSIDTSYWKAYNELAEDIAALVQKIQSDCTYVATLSDTSRHINNALRITQLHEREFLSKAQDLIKELWDIHEQWAQSKAFNTLKSISLLRTISQIQVFSSPLRQQINDISSSLKTAEFDRVVISRAIDMPYLYGALLFELVRRDEWLDVMKARVAQTAELMAGWREDEIKRRTKWIRQLGGSLGMLKRIGGGGSSGPGDSSDVPGVEITIINSSESKSYSLARKDIEQYLTLLKSLNLEEEYLELSKLVAKSDKINPFPQPSPAQQQQQQQQIIRRKSLFKEGNASEYSKSLLLSKHLSNPEPDMVLRDSTTLQSNNNNNNNNNLNDNKITGISEDNSTGDKAANLKIQVYEARIRKLEDLLHRNQFRDSWKNKFTSPTAATNSNTLVEASVNTVQVESLDSSEKQTFLEKIKALEEQIETQNSEIAKLKTENSSLSKDISAKSNSLEEAQMMKSDLIANLSTKEAEFNAERRSLVKEIDNLKNKIDDLEGELDREAENTINLEDNLDDYKVREQKLITQAKKAIHKEKKHRKSAERKSLRFQTKYDVLYSRAKNLSQRLYTSTTRSSDLLECLGMQITKEFDEPDGELLSFKIQRVKGLGRKARSALSATGSNPFTSSISDGPLTQDVVKAIDIDPSVFYWLDSKDSDEDSSQESDDTDSDDDVENDDDFRFDFGCNSDSDSDNDQNAENDMTITSSNTKPQIEENSESGSIISNINSIDGSILLLKQNSSDLPKISEGVSALNISETDGKTASSTSQKSTTDGKIPNNDDDSSTFSSVAEINSTQHNTSNENSNTSGATSNASIDTTNTDKDSIEFYSKALREESYEQRKQRKRLQRQNSSIIKNINNNNNNQSISDGNTSEKQKAKDKQQKQQHEKTMIKKKKEISENRLETYRRQASAKFEQRYQRFLNMVYIDYDLFRDSVAKRFGDVEHLARKLQKEARGYRERAHLNDITARNKIAFKGFKQGELALFLPTRDQSRDPNPWAAFNVGAPHYFLNPSPDHRLESREWLVARITKIEERVVDRARDKDRNANPFDLSDGLRWHLLEAVEE